MVWVENEEEEEKWFVDPQKVGITDVEESDSDDDFVSWIYLWMFDVIFGISGHIVKNVLNIYLCFEFCYLCYSNFFWKMLSRNIPMDVITWFDKIICDNSNLKKDFAYNVLTVALFSCLGMTREFRHLKFFKLLWDHVNLLNEL